MPALYSCGSGKSIENRTGVIRFHRELIRVVVLLFLCLPLLLSGEGWAEVCSSLRFYENRQYQGESRVFHPEQAVYTYVVLQGLRVGVHNLTIDWLDPTGEVQEQVHERFTVSKAGIYQRMFLFQLRRLGMFSRILAGTSYPAHFFGTWSCRLLLNGKRIKEYAFTIR